MPPDNGVRLDDHQRRAPVLPDSRQRDPKQSIATFEAPAPPKTAVASVGDTARTPRVT